MKNVKIIVIVSVLLLMLATVAYGLQEVLVLNLEFSKDGSVRIIDFSLADGEESFELSEAGDYRIEVLSKDNKVLYVKYFTPQFEIHTSTPLEGQNLPELITFLLEKRNVVLKLPYFEDGKTVRLFYKNRVVLEQEIVFCNNNGVCEPSGKENLLSCPSDCKSGSTDNYCDGIFDGICDQDCKNQGREEKDVDCTCGNNICDQRETQEVCPQDCKIELSFWQKLLNFIKSILTGLWGVKNET